MAFEFSDDDYAPPKKKVIGVPDLDGRKLEFESAWYLYYADLPSLGAAEAKKLHIDPIQLYTAAEKHSFSRARENVKRREKEGNVPTSI